MSIPLRLLIAEDSMDDAEVLLLALSHGGFDPVWKRVQTTAEMRAALQEAWEIVLADFSMPGFEAADALATCRDADPDLPFVVVSGTIGEAQAVEMMRAGASDYLLKGDLTRLVPVVERELREAINRRARRQSERAASRLAAIVESSHEAIVGMSLDGIITDWSPGATRQYGWSSEEAVGQSICMIVPPEGPEFMADLLQQVRNGESIEYFEAVRIRKDGTRLEVSASRAPIRDASGRVVGVSSISRDISEKKRAETLLREARATAEQRLNRLRAVVGSMTEGLIVCDAGGAMLDWNAAALRLHGFSTVDEVRRPLAWFMNHFELNSPEGSPVPLSEWPLARVMRGETLDGWELRLRRLDTSLECEVSYSGSPVRGPNGEVELAVLTVHDVTGRKRVEKEQALLAAVVESSEDAILCTGLDGRIQSWNGAAERMFGYTFAEVVGNRVPLVPPEFARDVLTRDERLCRGERFPPFESVRLRKSGEPIWVSITLSPVRVDGRVVSKSAVYRDITARKEAERESLLLRSIIEFSPNFIAVSQPDSRVVFVNRAGQSLLGLEGDAEIGRTTISDYHAAREMSRLEREVMPVLRIGGSVSGEVEFRHFRTGATIPAEWSVFAVPSPEGGESSYFACVAHDLTDRKRTEKAVRISEQRYRTLIRATAAIVWNTPASGAVTGELPEWSAFTGQTTEQIQGWGWLAAIHPDDRETTARAWSAAVAVQGDYRVEHRLRRADGVYRHMSARGVPILGDAGTIQEWIGVHTDLTGQKHTEYERAELLAQLNLQIERMPLAYLLTGPDFHYTRWNPAAERMFGFAEAEVLGRHPNDLIVPAVSHERVGQIFSRLASGDMNANGLGENVRKDGTAVFCEWHNTPLFGTDGKFKGILSLAQDVTDRRLAEQAVRASEERFRAFMDHGPATSDIKDEEGRFLYVNSAWLRQFENEPAGWQGKTNYDFWPRETADLFRASDERCLARNAAIEMEETALTAAGEVRTWIVMKFPLYESGHRRIGSMAWDISDKKRAEKAVSDAQIRLEHVLASSPAVLFTLAVADNKIVGITWISENIRTIFGYSTGDGLAEGWWLANVQPEEREKIVSHVREELFGKGHSAAEYRFRHMNGQYIWCRSEIRLIRDEKGVPVKAVGAWSDITARKLLEDQFRQAQKMDAFGQLAGGVAHDFNNLLTIINGYSELLIHGLAQGDPSRELAVEIHKAGERSAGLTRQLLAFSRQQVLAPRILNLNEVVAETDKMLRRMIGEDIRLTTTLATNAWAVLADAGQVQQVLLNLAVNARDAMPQGGRLTIETRNVELDENYVRSHKDASVGPHVLLSVTDTGSGIPPDVIGKIFEPFFTTKEVGKGTGLGLATVYGIVKQSGGHVDVYSEVAAGTAFKVYFPRAERGSKVSEAPSRITAPPRGTETILLAEDETGVRTLTTLILTGCGYTVLQAGDGDEAMRVAVKHNGPIHLLITDVVMPEKGGRSLAEQLLKRYPAARVLFISGYTDDAVIRHGVLQEGMNFLQKPFVSFALAQKVREVLDGR